MLALTLFALTNHVTVGPYTVIKFNLPDVVLSVITTWRASGRMIWPVFYLLVFTIIYIITRGYGKKTATMLLLIAVFVQVADLSAGYKHARKKLMQPPQSTASTSLTLPFWQIASTQYKNVRYIPTRHHHLPMWWEEIDKVIYAATHNMSTDITYVGRMDTIKMKNAIVMSKKILETGVYHQDSLYFINPMYALSAFNSINAETDLMVKIDGYYVVAPGWKKLKVPQLIEGELELIHTMKPPIIAVGSTIKFGANEDPIHLSHRLISGWAVPSKWGVWSDGKKATLKLVVAPETHGLVIRGHSVVTPNHLQRVEVIINGISVWSKVLPEGRLPIGRIEFPQKILDEVAAGKVLDIEFNLPDAESLKKLKIGSDDRALVIGLIEITTFGGTPSK